MDEFAEGIAVLSRWLGRDVMAGPEEGLPVVSAFRFRDAVVFQVDVPDCWGCMYLVRGGTVVPFVPSETSIDEAYGHPGREAVLSVVA